MTRCIVYLQRRAHRAGAQSCLARMLKHSAVRAWNPVLVCSEKGWLTQELATIGLPVLVQPFPSSRSWAGRLWFNRIFAQTICQRLQALNLAPVLIHGNDHAESLLTLALAQICRVPSVLHLRSGGMTQRDWEKYHCARHSLVIAVGNELKKRAQAWQPETPVHCVHDGLGPDEFAPPKPHPATFPQRLLVLGSPDPGKGWSDLADALVYWDKHGPPPMEFHFPAHADGKAFPAAHRPIPTRFQFVFLGRLENFAQTVRSYELAINPSRFESFGMAALETMAQGVALLSSRVGVVTQVITQPEYLFPPAQPLALAQTLHHLLQNWRALPFDTVGCQQRIHGQFSLDHTVKELISLYERALRGKF